MGLEAGLVKGGTDGSVFFPATLGCYKLQHHVCGPGETGLGGAKSTLGDPQTPLPLGLSSGEGARGILPKGR